MERPMVKSAALVVAVVLGLPGCSKPSSEGGAAPAKVEGGAPVAVELQLNWTPEPEFGGFYAAAQKGIYKQAGLDVTIKAGGAGIQTWQMVATGKVPFAIAESGEILRARLQNADLVALYAVYQKSPQSLMVHKESGVTTLEEIFTSGKIKKVAMEPGLPYVKFLEKKFGFGKVEVVQHGGNLSLFLADKAMAQQCFIFAEPVSAKEQGVEVAAFSTADAGFNPYLAVVITSGKYLAEHRDVVEKFVRATRDGWKVYLEDPATTNEYLKQQGATLSMQTMNLAAELQKPYVTGDGKAERLGQMTLERWKSLAEQLKELGELAEVPDVTKAFEDFK